MDAKRLSKWVELLDRTTVVIYHMNCIDGFASASIFYRYLKSRVNVNGIKFVGCTQYNISDHLRSLKADDCVVVVDISISPSWLEYLGNSPVESLLLIDHHQETLNYVASDSGSLEISGKLHVTKNDTNVAIFCDEHRCASTLCWNLLYPKVTCNRFVQFVEDRDLWLWRFGNSSREFNVGLWHLKKQWTLDAWSRYVSDPEDEIVDKFRLIGQKLLPVQNTQISGIITRGAASVTLRQPNEAYRIISVMSHQFKSEIGDRICRHFDQIDFALIWSPRYRSAKFGEPKSIEGFVCSLRTNKPHVDVSRIASHFDGGGHRCAAAFFYRSNNIYDLFRTYRTICLSYADYVALKTT